MAERNPARNIEKLRTNASEDLVTELDPSVTQYTPLSDELYPSGVTAANLLGTTFGNWPATHGYLNTNKQDDDYGSQTYTNANQDDQGSFNRIWSPLGGLSNIDITTLTDTGKFITCDTGWALNDTWPNDIDISSDGNYLFLVHKNSNRVVRFDLVTPYDIGVVTQSTSSYSYAGDGINNDTGVGLSISPDGTKMYVLDSSSGNKRIYEYTLGTPWELNTASLITSKDISPWTQQPLGMKLSDNGERCYISNYGANILVQLNLATPWDISSATLGHNLSVISGPKAVAVKSDGSQVILACLNNTNGYKLPIYNLSTPWELSTAIFGGYSGNTANNPSGLCISSNSTYLYKCSQDSDLIRMYTLDPPVGVASWTAWQEIKSPEQITQETNDAIATHVSTVDHLARIRTVYVDDAGGNVEFDTGTTFTDISEVDVFLNGLRILAGTEFIASTTGGNENSHIELTAATVALDDLEIITWKVQ